MKNDSSTMKEVLNIRAAVYAEIKDLPPEKQTEYFSDASLRLEREYGIRLRRPAPTPSQKAM
jgi:hypothetical protein